MKKKQKMILLAGVLVLVGGFFVMRGRGGDDAMEAAERRKVSLPTNIVDVLDRPYIAIKPLADGKNLDIYIDELKLPADEVEYELEYQAGTLLQGAFGTVDAGKLPTETRILLGSCSAGGACTYHEDVKGGSLLTRYIGGKEDYALKSDWKYIDNVAKDTEISSKDAKFQLDGVNLAKQRYIVVFNSPGLPETAPGELVSEIYSLETSSALTGKAELTIRANEEGELKIAAWDGSEWTTYEGEVDGKAITAEVDLTDLYVVVR